MVTLVDAPVQHGGWEEKISALHMGIHMGIPGVYMRQCSAVVGNLQKIKRIISLLLNQELNHNS